MKNKKKMEAVSDDLILCIFNFLTVRELVVVSQVSKKWRLLSHGIDRTVERFDRKNYYHISS